MAKLTSFRELRAWQSAMDLACVTYELTGKMPNSERFGLVSQMRRAAVSIPANIAEGYGRQSRPDYLRHLRIARGSLAELDTQAELSITMGLVQPNEEYAELIRKTGAILQALIMRLEEKG